MNARVIFISHERSELVQKQDYAIKIQISTDSIGEYFISSLGEKIENDPIISLRFKNELDAIIYGTGFKTAQFSHMFNLEGINNRKLFEEWDINGGEAYYGMASNDMPNFLFLVGPNSGLSHTSIIHVMESQYNYALDYLKKLKKRPNSFLNLKHEVLKKFNDKIQKKLSKMIWYTGGCRSWYISGVKKKNVTIWPGSTISYRFRTRKVNLSDYHIVNIKR